MTNLGVVEIATVALAVIAALGALALVSFLYATYLRDTEDVDRMSALRRRVRRDEDLGTALVLLLDPPCRPRHWSGQTERDVHDEAVQVCQGSGIGAADLDSAAASPWSRRTVILALMSGMKGGALAGPEPDPSGLEVLVALKGLQVPDGTASSPSRVA